jgi:hypothetical protein
MMEMLSISLVGCPSMTWSDHHNNWEPPDRNDDVSATTTTIADGEQYCNMVYSPSDFDLRHFIYCSCTYRSPHQTVSLLPREGGTAEKNSTFIENGTT